MLMRLCFILLAASLVAKPLLMAAGGGCDCGCCGPSDEVADLSDASAPADAPGACCCLGVPAMTQASGCHEPEPQDERERPGEQPQNHQSGCDCPKSCCSSTVKVQLATARVQNAWPRGDENDMKWARPFFQDTFRSDPALSRLDRPPRGMTAA